MKICSKCKESKPLEDFYRQSRQKDGYQRQCKTCANIMSAASEKKKADKYKVIRKKAKDKLREAMWKYKEERGCQHCPEKDPICLELHHPDPTQKDLEPSSAHSLKLFHEEADKCIVLCSNCHRKEHRRINRGVD